MKMSAVLGQLFQPVEHGTLALLVVSCGPTLEVNLTLKKYRGVLGGSVG